MRASDDKSHGLISAALLAVVVSLAGLAGAVKIAQSAVALGPSVGDIVRFDANGRMPVDMKTEVDASRVNGTSCVLDMETIHQAGGSLIVEQRMRGQGQLSYRVHWAGGPTADGADNCGRHADLVVDDANLDLLAMAAGGWGALHHNFSASALWSFGGSAAATR